ncbi:MAG: PepSY-associated TM helix domain-containing protein [Bacteroidota bacterium]
MTIKKLIGQLHLWLGLISGLVVFILGITGCIWAFEEEIKAWAYADKLTVEVPVVAAEPIALSQHLEAAQQALGPDIPVQRMTVENSPEKSVIFRSFAPNKDTSGIWYWDEIKHNLWVYVNPHTSEVVKKEDQTFEFFNFVLWLHWSLLLKNDIGQPIVGAATLMFVFLLISGLVLWWPKNRAARKQRFWFRWKPTTRWKRKNYDLHNILGFYSMFLVIFIALTGLMWAFTWFNDGVQWIANGGKTIEKERQKVESTLAPLVSTHPVDRVYHHLQAQHPEATTYYLNLPKDSSGTIGSFVKYEDRTQSVSLQFDQYSGKQLASTGWADKTNGEKVRAYNYDIHVGAIGGLPGKVIAFFLSLFAASLPVTGFMIWWGRRKKERSQNARRRSRSGSPIRMGQEKVRATRKKTISTLEANE